MLLLAALLAGAGGEVLEARLRAAVEEKLDVIVRLEYRIRLLQGAQRVPFSFLEIGEVTIEDVSAFASGVPLQVEIESRRGRKLRGAVVIPEGSSAPFPLELRYVVRDGAEPLADGVRASLPLAILELALADTGASLFSAAVQLPTGLRVIDGFPSNPKAGADDLYHWELPLVPTFVSFRASSGSGLLSPPSLASTGLIVLLLLAGVVGIRRARATKS